VAKVSRSFLRYYGGKWKLAPWIISHFPPHKIYVEPYGGAASVLLQKPRSGAEIYNDLDGQLVNLFRIVRERGAELKAALELTPFSRADFELSYQPAEDALERARRAIVRSFMGYSSNSLNRNSGFRSSVNRTERNAALDWKNYPAHLPIIIERLRGVVLENREAQEVMLNNDTPTTLHYVDPPYVHETRACLEKKSLYQHEMNEASHRRLAEFLKTLSGKVIISGYASPLYDELFQGWQRYEREAFTINAAPRLEVLWLRGCEESSLF
jgi:DNA adenine methylase